jgi:glycerophosphoryl diester phosphodiesterase
MRLSLLSPLDTLIAPPPRPDRIRFLAAQAYAHRGLHGHGVVENSRAAFQAAIDKGLGIELDIQPAAGGQAFVFHDTLLDRLTDDTGPVAKRTAQQLDQIRLRNSHETLPRLSEILSIVAGRVPILIEIKTNPNHTSSVGSLGMAVRRDLEGYRGAVAVMSFNPNVAAWFHEHAPKMVRGLVVTEEKDGKGFGRMRGRVLRHISLWRARPDFLAYDIRDLPSRFPAEQRARGLKILTWTVRTAHQERVAMTHADEIIFEQPKPQVQAQE